MPASVGASGVLYDDSEWPIFTVKMPPRALSDKDFQDHLEACSVPYLRGEPFVFLFDTTGHPPLSASQRKAVANAMVAHNSIHPGLLRGIAVVVGSAFERGVVTAIRWIARPRYPIAAFDSIDKARSWLLAQLAGSSRPHPPVFG
jgi:hypothetical protein